MGGAGGGGGKKSKQGSASTGSRPQYIQVCGVGMWYARVDCTHLKNFFPLISSQVCDRVVSAISSGEPLSPYLTARMIKYMVLKRRSKEVAEKKAVTEVYYDIIVAA